MTRVAIFEDNKHLRESLQMLLNGTPGFICAGAFADCFNLVSHIESAECDLVLMDIEMPGMNGIEATIVLKEKFPQLQVLIQTIFFDDDYIFRAICAGASGYILKSTTLSGYIDALNNIKEGGSPMTPGIARRVFELFKNNLEVAETGNHNLTDRELAILQQLTKGKSYKMIANELFISPQTVKTHIKNIYSKLHVHSGTEAIAKAFRDKIV